MSGIEMIISEREADIGHFKVGRLLPYRPFLSGFGLRNI
jgi:hypothetical protein